jgi:hypothetical protein
MGHDFCLLSIVRVCAQITIQHPHEYPATSNQRHARQITGIDTCMHKHVSMHTQRVGSRVMQTNERKTLLAYITYIPTHILHTRATQTATSNQDARDEDTPRFITPAARSSRNTGTNKGSTGSTAKNKGKDEGSDMELTPVSETKTVVSKGSIKNNAKDDGSDMELTPVSETKIVAPKSRVMTQKSAKKVCMCAHSRRYMRMHMIVCAYSVL